MKLKLKVYKEVDKWVWDVVDPTQPWYKNSMSGVVTLGGPYASRSEALVRGLAALEEEQARATVRP